MSGTRLERDSLGDVSVPSDRLWGAQTERAIRHFDISTERMPRELILALALVKRCAALVNQRLGALDDRKAQVIAAAADEVIAGRHEAEFPLAVWQTGSGTQTNMNMNEVLANRASVLLGGQLGGGRLVHPNDDVNRGQSSNDVFPTAMTWRRSAQVEGACCLRSARCATPWRAEVARRSRTSSRSGARICRTRRR